jgi:hypothetical protein
MIRDASDFGPGIGAADARIRGAASRCRLEILSADNAMLSTIINSTATVRVRKCNAWKIARRRNVATTNTCKMRVAGANSTICDHLSDFGTTKSRNA